MPGRGADFGQGAATGQGVADKGVAAEHLLRPLHRRKTHSLSPLLLSPFRSLEHRALHRRRHGAANDSIKPVIVAPLGSHLPFVHGSSTPLRLHAILGG